MGLLNREEVVGMVGLGEVDIVVFMGVMVLYLMWCGCWL